jgi:hypothetical protein
MLVKGQRCLSSRVQRLILHLPKVRLGIYPIRVLLTVGCAAKIIALPWSENYNRTLTLNAGQTLTPKEVV